MKVVPTDIRGMLIIEPEVFGDSRGFFYESFNQRAFREATGIAEVFVQDNQSRSHKGVLRGLHYQVTQPQGKLIRVVRGAVFDVVVDIRADSPTFGRWVATQLTEENRRQVWAPPGVAHGYLVISDVADLLYKATDYYAPQFERCIKWDDPILNISWPFKEHGITAPQLSDKDLNGSKFSAYAWSKGK
ncbi:dTDP-4-dehydrorhamnose 3,5-epimerase [Ralstonia wenshanensis]|uniref:dTDP-4-dehydrorhamnose 3,5-epimerase n=1 Tax=Ralstonia wenshanensis TaxID=2842456 RepID=A0AAD2ARP7_9RALS|nr:dTDP-4-dehydrorhamnose 3,5-epimerase [Ralstonia wenshanensis]CAJ0686493.1 dTDP-4-dehydrorhamnose 3,5-epimerase [Ralstonia wenshanensis]